MNPSAPAASAAASLSANGYSAQVAKLAAETERRVKVIEERQLALAAALASEDVDAATLKRLGFYPSKAGHEGQGGPFDGNADPTFKQLFTSWKKLDNLASSAIAIPSDKPVRTAAFTSGYGVRNDPFRGGHAMHAGIDLAGPYGTPIYATADGTVERAGWNNGGYGNLIELDHGRGIETRYGHLSRILINAGQQVKRGQLIAYMRWAWPTAGFARRSKEGPSITIRATGTSTSLSAVLPLAAGTLERARPYSNSIRRTLTFRPSSRATTSRFRLDRFHSSLVTRCAATIRTVACACRGSVAIEARTASKSTAEHSGVSA